MDGARWTCRPPSSRLPFFLPSLALPITSYARGHVSRPPRALLGLPDGREEGDGTMSPRRSEVRGWIGATEAKMTMD